MKKYDFSKMKDVAVIKEPTLTPDGAGGYSVAWDDFMTIWVQAVPLSSRGGDERFRYDQLKEQDRYLLIARAIEGITCEMRVEFSSGLFDITGITKIEKDFLEISVEEVLG